MIAKSMTGNQHQNHCNDQNLDSLSTGAVTSNSSGTAEKAEALSLQNLGRSLPPCSNRAVYVVRFHRDRLSQCPVKCRDQHTKPWDAIPIIYMKQAAEPVELAIRIEPSDIDELGHVNNVTYVRWVQDAAVAHWTAAAGAADQAALRWVVLRHEIDYQRAA